MLNKNSLGLLKKGTANQSRIKSIVWHLRWLVRTRADISLRPSGLVRSRTDIKLQPSESVRSRTDIKLQPSELVRSRTDIKLRPSAFVRTRTNFKLQTVQSVRSVVDHLTQWTETQRLPHTLTSCIRHYRLGNTYYIMHYP